MNKIISRSVLKKEIEKLKKTGKKIVFANGCFDVIHVGHIRYLRGAKRLGDILVVGVNSDTSIKKLKGKTRPVLPQKDRLKILAAMEMVDYVTVFNELTANKILKIIKPDVHAKGTDYTEQNVPEKGLLGKYVGKIAIVGDKKQHSTRDIINNIKTNCVRAYTIKN